MTGVLKYAVALIGSALGAATIFTFCLVQPWGLTPALHAPPMAQLVNLFLLVFVVAIAHAFLLGLPVGLLIKKFDLVSARSAALGGFLIGALPLTLWLALTPPPSYSSSGGVVTAIDGVCTAEGWWEILRGSGLNGAAGLVGGLCALVIWRRLTRHPTCA